MSRRAPGTGFEINGHPTDRDVAWRQLGDTDWMNRIAGSGRMLEQHVEPDDNGFTRVLGSMQGPLGRALPFEEVDSSWVNGRYFHQERVYDSPFLARSRYAFRLEPREDGSVVPVASLELEPARSLLRPLVALNLDRIRRKWQQVLNRLPSPGAGGLGIEPARTLPPAAREAVQRWAAVDPEIAERTRAHIATGRAVDLHKIRPFALADQWSLDREETLEAMLRSVPLGVLELYWSVQCPRCYGQAASSPSLSDLSDHAECSSCRIGFTADLGENIEVVFAPHPSIMPRMEETFCTVFPTGAPRIQSVHVLAASQQRTETVPLFPGRWRIGAGGDEPDRVLHVERDGGETSLTWRPSGEREPAALRAGDIDLRLHNDSGGRRKVWVFRADEQDDVVLASLVTSLASFRRTMGHQVLSPDQRISVRSVTLLFTDLSGSTALYEELGDASAYAVVRDHFALLRRIIEENRGTPVKTIGDAIMASFHAPAQAMGAALSMVRAFYAWRDELELRHPPGLRVGLHVGQALVVHTDATGLDYFGRTVNIAARAEGKAAPGEVVWTDAMHAVQSVRDVLADHELTAEALDADLKGIDTPVRLYRTRVAG